MSIINNTSDWTITYLTNFLFANQRLNSPSLSNAPVKPLDGLHEEPLKCGVWNAGHECSLREPAGPPVSDSNDSLKPALATLRSTRPATISISQVSQPSHFNSESRPIVSTGINMHSISTGKQRSSLLVLLSTLRSNVETTTWSVSEPRSSVWA